MGFDIASAGADVAGGLLGSIFGSFLQDGQDERQLKQTEELQQIQLRNAKKMQDYTMASQYDMWNKTNYGAQKKHMEAAGLNPALMYGMKGGGGVTTGSQGGGMPSTGTAGDPNRGAMDIAEMAQMGANRKLIEAQTKKTEAEAANIAGAQTELQGAQTASLTQGIENAKAVEVLTKIETQLKEVTSKLANESLNDTLSKIRSEAISAEQEAVKALAEANVTVETQNSKIALIKQEAVNAVLESALIKANTSESYSKIEVNKAQVSKIANEIVQKWTELNQGQQKVDIQKFSEEIKANYQPLWNTIGRWGEDAWGTVIDVVTGKEYGNVQNDFIKKIK